VIDFGLARILQTSGFTTATSKGTWRYWAPERLHDVEGIQQITTATDVYAFSMAVVEVSISILLFFPSKKLSVKIQIFTGRIPFPHIKNDAAVVITVIQGGRPQRDRCLQVTDDIWKMLERCWDADPKRRPSMANVACFLGWKLTSPAGQLARY
jgi:serine/threonine protein kinase